MRVQCVHGHILAHKQCVWFVCVCVNARVYRVGIRVHVSVHVVCVGMYVRVYGSVSAYTLRVYALRKSNRRGVKSGKSPTFTVAIRWVDGTKWSEKGPVLAGSNTREVTRSELSTHAHEKLEASNTSGRKRPLLAMVDTSPIPLHRYVS